MHRQWPGGFRGSVVDAKTQRDCSNGNDCRAGRYDPPTLPWSATIAMPHKVALPMTPARRRLGVSFLLVRGQLPHTAASFGFVSEWFQIPLFRVRSGASM